MQNRSAPTSPPEMAEVEQGFDLHETLSFVWRQWKLIASVTALVLVIGAVILLREVPLYTATSEVLLNRPQQTLPGGDAIVPEIQLDVAMVESQMAIIRSPVFLRRVVEKYGLLSDPTFGPPPAPHSAEVAGSWPRSLIPPSVSSLFSSAFAYVEGPQTDRPAPDVKPVLVRFGGDPITSEELHVIEALQGSLQVSQVAQQGYVLAISVTSPNPAEAAQLSNDISDAYLVDKLDSRFEAAKRASAWLADRLVQLRKQLHASEEAVTAFRAAHGFVETGSTTLTQQQLADLNNNLIEAQADLAQKKAQVEQLHRIQAEGGSLETMPDIINAGALPSLRAEAADLTAKEANLLSRYGPAYPLVINVRAQLGDVERTIGAETGRLAASIRNEYQLAQARVASLQAALREATGQTNIDNATAIHLRELERTAAVNKTLFDDFLKQAKVTQAQSTFQPQDVRVIAPALTPTTPASPHKSRFMIVTAFIGLLFGVGGAYAREKLQAGFATPRQVEDLLGLPLLTSVSHVTAGDLRVGRQSVAIYELPAAKPLSRYSEAIRSLRSGIHMTNVDNPPKVIQVTSAVPEEGKTTIALSLATSAATAKLRVLFIDADLRHPTATRAFGLQKAPGLVDLLLGEVDVADVIKLHERGGYWAVGAGNKTQNPTDLLGSDRMKALVASFREVYDLVLIDTPPVGPVVDPAVVSRLSDKIVVVVKWGDTARELVKQCVDQLSGHPKVAGVAFNQVNDRLAQKYGKHAYAYYYGSRYYKNYYSE
jgi:polysaccharide biosynthesis transport protein